MLCVCVQCLAEIATLPIEEKYSPRLLQMYVAAMTQLVTMIPVGSPIPKLYDAGSSDDKMFFQRLALFFTSFFVVRFVCCVVCCRSGSL